MSTPKWFESYEQAHHHARRRDAEEEVLTELTFALEAAAWFKGATYDCA